MLGIDPGQRMYLSEQLLREQSEAKRVMFDALAGSVTNGEHRVLDHASHTWLHIEAADAVVQGIRDMLGNVRPCAVSMRGCSAWRKPDEPREPASSLSGPTSIELWERLLALAASRTASALSSGTEPDSLGPA